MEELYLYDRTTPFFSLNGLKLYGRVVDIIDGDTIICVIPLFENKYYKFYFRLDSIDTCEMKSKNELNKKLALSARKLLFHLITNKEIDEHLSKHEISDLLNEKSYLVWIECLNYDKFGRVLSRISLNENSESFSDILVNKKLAYIYHGEKKLSEEEQLIILTEEDDKCHLP